MKFYFVYILKCSDNTYYTGFTSNLDKRLQQHKEGYDRESYTYKRRPVELQWVEQFTDPNHAIAIEKQLKGWSHRKKLALIEEDWEKLVEYSKNKYNSNKLE
ncbi:putative endonuclease [Salinimicrobium catena]|uniref:Putative endonuclease n=1 Tax=Salinimicrobium catena TaxID=390640 RepID=A0A1H5PF08_9FLAO|nr:GIY-YIG nuclease family protein [Salinimicrobium catena]SDL81489.1 putative endonuclease [Salinimicrobium catena]SEF12204.1 putative endonuclease [Salinimicrobium catena]